MYLSSGPKDSTANMRPTRALIPAARGTDNVRAGVSPSAWVSDKRDTKQGSEYVA